MLEKHHIVKKSQLGLDFELNYKYLTSEEHRGDLGPHKNRDTDLHYKKELETSLRALLRDTHYFESELIQLLGLDSKQADKAFRHLQVTSKGMDKEEIIFRLMGNRYYL